MTLISVLHHDGESSLFSLECTAGVLSNALVSLANDDGVGNTSNPTASVANRNNALCRASYSGVHKTSLSGVVEPCSSSSTAPCTTPPLYTHVELLPLSFVTELMNNTKVMTALQYKESVYQQDQAAHKAKSAQADIATPLDTPLPPTHSYRSSALPVSLSTSSPPPTAVTSALTAVLHNMPFVGLLSASVQLPARHLPCFASANTSATTATNTTNISNSNTTNPIGSSSVMTGVGAGTMYPNAVQGGNIMAGTTAATTSSGGTGGVSAAAGGGGASASMSSAGGIGCVWGSYILLGCRRARSHQVSSLSAWLPLGANADGTVPSYTLPAASLSRSAHAWSTNANHSTHALGAITGTGTGAGGVIALTTANTNTTAASAKQALTPFSLHFVSSLPPHPSPWLGMTDSAHGYPLMSVSIPPMLVQSCLTRKCCDTPSPGAAMITAAALAYASSTTTTMGSINNNNITRSGSVAAGGSATSFPSSSLRGGGNAGHAKSSSTASSSLLATHNALSVFAGLNEDAVVYGRRRLVTQPCPCEERASRETCAAPARPEASGKKAGHETKDSRTHAHNTHSARDAHHRRGNSVSPKSGTERSNNNSNRNSNSKSNSSNSSNNSGKQTATMDSVSQGDATRAGMRDEAEVSAAAGERKEEDSADNRGSSVTTNGSGHGNGASTTEPPPALFSKLPLSQMARSLLGVAPPPLAVNMNLCTIGLTAPEAPGVPSASRASAMAEGERLVEEDYVHDGSLLDARYWTHVLERVESIDVLWQGAAGEHVTLQALLREYVALLRSKMLTAREQLYTSMNAHGDKPGAGQTSRGGSAGRKKRTKA